MLGRNVIVVGASAGGVPALSQLLQQLPADLNAAILVVLHVGNMPSVLPKILAGFSKLPLSHPADGEEIETGHVYVAPPDLHMMVEQGRIRLAMVRRRALRGRRSTLCSVPRRSASVRASSEWF